MKRTANEIAAGCINVRSVKDLIISAKATMMEDAVICVGLQRSTALKITLSSSVIYP